MLSNEQIAELQEWIDKPGRYKLLTIAQYKTDKSKARGYFTSAINLSPEKSSGIANVCPWAENCNRPGACLQFAGRNKYDMHIKARRMRTYWYFHDRKGFYTRLRKEIETFMRLSDRLGLKPAIRPNCLSDLPSLAQWVAVNFPDIPVYDYTKQPMLEWKFKLPNYSRTFSYSGSNEQDCFWALNSGENVSVVFSTHRKEMLPKRIWGYKVIDGDKDDLRFLDPKGVVVGLRAKGRLRWQIGVNPFIVVV